MITLALAKGRLLQGALGILERSGVDCAVLKQKTRELVLQDASGKFCFLLVKPTDVPTYVDSGVADAGIVGRDTLMEANRPLYEMIDLGFERCTMCVAGFADRGQRAARGTLRVATKFPHVARSWYARQDRTIEIIPLYGSVELGPLVGLSDVIVDIVASGDTLRANGLTVLEELFPVSARMVVNQASLKVKAAELRPWLARVAAICAEEGGNG